ILRDPGEDPFDCGGTEPVEEPFISYCACISDINDNFDYDNNVCLSPNLGPILTGGGIGAGASVAAGPWWMKLSKRLTGLPGLAVQAGAGFVVGASAIYSIDTAACKLRAKSRRDRDMNKALNELYRVLANGQNFVCPSGVH
ncbi:MAG: hypothetical protein NXI07_03720, partial [bacterium]|nr:hypothetical protein [bacterium]